MEINHWTSRISIVWEKYTMKIHKIKLGILNSINKVLKSSRKHWTSHEITKNMLLHTIKCWFNKNLWNIQSNLREYNLSKKYPEIVMDTKISIFGILNIQKTWNIIPENDNILLWGFLLDQTSNHNLMVREWHTFAEWWNFAINPDWNIKLIDAWSVTMEDTLQKEWNNILEAMNRLEILFHERNISIQK